MFVTRNGIPSPSDEHLMQMIAKGERWAFELLYERYFDKLVWFARSFVEDEQKAEDIIQDVFMRIIENPVLFDTGKRFSTWVYTAAGNACKNTLRNEQNRSRLLMLYVAPGYAGGEHMHDEAEKSLLRQRIRKACDELNEKEKNVFVLRFEQELSIKEIAGITGLPEGSVKSTLYYLLRKIAPYLKDFAYEN